jgi:AcrR family transcriptional regulator
MVKSSTDEAAARRAYNSNARKAAARATRQSILDVARRIFLERGYAGATMPTIAKQAGIALDTVYASVGSKPVLFKLLVETAISGSDSSLEAEDRDYVHAIRAEPDAAGKLKIYAAALAAIQPRLAPIFKVLQAAAPQDEALNLLWQDIANRRAANMRLLAQDLMATGRVRPDLIVERVADIIWSMNGPEFFLLLVEGRRWAVADFERWLADAWVRLLLVG